MKIKIDDEVVYELSEVQIKCVQHVVPCAWKWLKDGPLNFINRKSQMYQDGLIKEWLPLLAQIHDVIPSSKDDICELIFADPRYKCRKTREDEAIAQRIADQEAAEAAALAEAKARSIIEQAQRQKELEEEEIALQAMVAQAVQDALVQNLTISQEK